MDDYVKDMEGVVFTHQSVQLLAEYPEGHQGNDPVTTLNRVVIAACSPRTHEPLFQETLKDAGLNRNMFEMVNIRDHCSWVHANGAGSEARISPRTW